jgi:divalent metal cation (Fe/Co/Zn/Cd) transporter
MTDLLVKIFIRDNENIYEPDVRRRYGQLSGGVGIFLNLLLSAGKFTAGLLTGSIAITADAFNNLSDAASSVITAHVLRVV